MAKNQKNSIQSDESLDILKRVLSENWQNYTWQYAQAFVLLVAVSASTAFPAWAIYNIVEDVFMRQDLDVAYSISFAIFLAFTVRGLATYGYMYVLGKISNNMVARYQKRVYAHLLNLGVGFYKENRSAYLVGQINQNIAGMREMLNQFITVFARDLLTLIAMITVMVIRDPFMSLSSLLVLPIIYLVMSRYVRKVRRVAREAVNINARVTSSIVETTQGIEVVKSFTMEEALNGNMEELTKEVETQANHIVRLNAKTKPPTEILAGLAIAGVVAYGGYRVAELGHSPGGLFSFLVAAMLAYDPARKLASFRVSFESSLVNARMLYELLDMPERQADKSDAKTLELGKGHIDFKNITFSYNGDETIRVLHDVNIVARAGKTTALVGPSGGGKSTLIALLQRFHDINEGSIEIDGQNIADVTAKSLRSKIAYVSQQPMLFEGTIMDNIRYGRPGADDEAVYEAAKKAQAHDFILKQSEGYATSVAELGGNLSGGQRQRISIARAILRDAPILILDEATSALDNESEKLVQKALEQLMEGRTTIVVAHRLSTIRDADNIVVIDGGRVVEQGSHAKLIKKKTGIYSKLYAIGTATAELKDVEI
ncbi:MAG: ABC transporter ATP-binding protein [Rhizobiaceae bacterium]